MTMMTAERRGGTEMLVAVVVVVVMMVIAVVVIGKFRKVQARLSLDRDCSIISQRYVITL